VLSLAFPAPPRYTEPAVWTGQGFMVGKIALPILSYEAGSSGWTEELTRFHEQIAGSGHFIDQASREHALQQLSRHVKGPSPVILDIGCSSGFMLHSIRRHLPHALLLGSDYVRGPLEQLAADMPDIPLLHFDLVKCPLSENSIDAIVLLNVLEHIADDATAVRQVYRILKPGGSQSLRYRQAPTCTMYMTSCY
jgi:SAM-dependent methyltransferase